MRLGIEAGKDTLDAAKELGVSGVPVSAEQLVKDGVDAVLAPLRDQGLSVCQIGAFGFNPLSTDRERQSNQERILKDAIPLAAATGCPYVVICGGNYHPSGFASGDPRNFTDQALDELARGLEPVLELAERYGVKLSIEAYLKTAISTPERFLELKKRLKSEALRVNIDVTSFYAYWDMWDPTDIIERTCNLLAEHYGLCHIKEVALLDGFHIHANLAPLGSGVTDWSRVLSLVEPHLPGDSWVILEHVQSLEEARMSVGLLREAAKAARVSLV